MFSNDDGYIPPCNRPQTKSSPIQFDPRGWGVLTQLTKLDPRKGAGPDELSPALLKYLSQYIYEPLTKVFQYFYDLRQHKTGKQPT